jgi:hypothetical protein
METPFSQLNLSSVEHVWIEYNVAESPLYAVRINHVISWEIKYEFSLL